MAPGLVPAGEEIPVANAAVYLASGRPGPIPNGAYCEPCTEIPADSTTTDAAGEFTLPNAIPGHQWLIIQKGQFRLEQEIDITATTIELTTAQTTMPSDYDPTNGHWIPRIAIAAGSYDHLESIFGKMGIGTVGGDGVFSGTAGRLDLIDNGGPSLGASIGSLAAIARDPSKLMSYHIIFVPCSGDDNTSALRDPQVLKNLRDYVKQGGKLYVTDWSGEWMDNVFPTQIQLGGGAFGERIDTPSTAYNPAADSWNAGEFGNADGDAYDSPDADAIDAPLAAWLGGQHAPTPASTTVAPINPHNFEAVDNWNYIQQVVPVQVGVDANNQPVFDMPHVYVTGSNPQPFGGGGQRHPLTVTFEPAGCGRVLYSTYHTSQFGHPGLYPQERILLYLIMEIGVCSDNPVIL